MLNIGLENSRSSVRKGIERFIKYGIAFALAAAFLVPVQLSAIPIAFNVAGQVQDAASDQLRNDLQYVHCCHSHPRAPYDSYCCHSGGAYVARGAVAYGAYRGVKSAAKKHYNRAPRRRR